MEHEQHYQKELINKNLNKNTIYLKEFLKLHFILFLNFIMFEKNVFWSFQTVTQFMAKT